MRILAALVMVGTCYAQGVNSSSVTLIPKTNSSGGAVGGGTLTMRDAFGGSQPWILQNFSANKSGFSYGAKPIVTLDNSGSPLVGGGGAEVIMPSLFVTATATNSPSMIVKQIGGGTADIFDVTLSGGTKAFSVDSTGATRITNCVSGCGAVTGSSPIVVTGSVISCPTCFTTAGGIITGNTVEELALQFGAGTSAMQWQIISTISNYLAFQDSSSNTRMSLNAAGTGGHGVLLTGPGAQFVSTNGNEPAVLALASPSQATDIFAVTNPGGLIGTKYLYVDSSGGTHIQNCVSGCSGTTGVTSLNALTGALTIAGTANQVSVAAGGSTVTLSLPSIVNTTLFNSTAVGAAIGFQAGSGNFQVDGAGDVSGAGVFNTASSYQVQNILGGQVLATLAARQLLLPGTVGVNAVLINGSSSTGGRAQLYDNAGVSKVDITAAGSSACSILISIGPACGIVITSRGSETLTFASGGVLPYVSMTAGASTTGGSLALAASSANSAYGISMNANTTNGGLIQSYDNPGNLAVQIFGSGSAPATSEVSISGTASNGGQVQLRDNSLANVVFSANAATALISPSSNSFALQVQNTGSGPAAIMSNASGSSATSVLTLVPGSSGVTSLSNTGTVLFQPPVAWAAAPSGACTNGQFYVRSDAGAGMGSSGYVCYSATWHAVF